jgi:hypothetical protein
MVLQLPRGGKAEEMIQAEEMIPAIPVPFDRVPLGFVYIRRCR